MEIDHSQNINYVWSHVVLQTFAILGVKHCVVAPGSRSTSLVIAASKIDSLRKVVHLDERACGFFTLGIGKATGVPAIILCTSGTAVGELYPSVIEAYQSRIPLILISADRPPHYRNTGANQTINQKDIFSNHIRLSLEIKPSSLSKKKIKQTIKILCNSFDHCTNKNPGPIHLNIPFEKPFEPRSKHSLINIEEINKIFSIDHLINILTNKNEIALSKSLQSNIFNELKKKIVSNKKCLILIGANTYSDQIKYKLVKLVSNLKIPIYTDVSSGFRCFMDDCVMITNIFYLTTIRWDVIIKLGSPPTLLESFDFLRNSKSNQYLLNEYGELKFEANSKKHVLLNFTIKVFLYLLEECIHTKRSNEYNQHLFHLEQNEVFWRDNVNSFLNSHNDLFEGNIINQIILSLPNDSNIFISNSLPIRDANLFSFQMKKSIKVFSNRGASGIDGIIATSFGIQFGKSFERTVLLVGDISFIYDLTSLIIGRKENIPLLIVILNNNGGHIFNQLPIFTYSKSITKKYFENPHNLEIKELVKAFGIPLYSPTNLDMLKLYLVHYCDVPKLTVIHIETNGRESKKIRRDFINYWTSFYA